MDAIISMNTSLNKKVYHSALQVMKHGSSIIDHRRTSRGGGERGGLQPPPNFGQLRLFGQQEKIWEKPFFKSVSVFFFISLKRQIFSILI